MVHTMAAGVRATVSVATPEEDCHAAVACAETNQNRLELALHVQVKSMDAPRPAEENYRA